MTNSPTRRMVGLDALRAIAMLMIVIWHFFYEAIGSTPFPGTTTGTVNYLLSEFIVVCCSTCVNIFVLISSYFLIDKSFNAARLLRLWFQVVFYSVGLALLFFFISPGNVSWKELAGSFFPVSTYSYWFFSIYLGFTCMVPFLAKTSMALSRKDYRVFLLVLIIFCCTFSLMVPLGNTMGAAKGYSLLWFIALYFWGAYFKRFDIRFGRNHYPAIFVILALAVTAFCVGKAFLLHNAGRGSLSLEFPAYNSWAFLLSIPLFLYFKDKTFAHHSAERTVSALAPFTFAVYLISEQAQLRQVLWNGTISWTSFLGRPWFILLMFGVSLTLFFICIGIDLFRAMLFKRIRIPQGCDAFCQKITDRFFSFLKKHDC